MMTPPGRLQEDEECVFIYFFTEMFHLIFSLNHISVGEIES